MPLAVQLTQASSLPVLHLEPPHRSVVSGHQRCHRSMGSDVFCSLRPAETPFRVSAEQGPVCVTSVGFSLGKKILLFAF